MNKKTKGIVAAILLITGVIPIVSMWIIDIDSISTGLVLLLFILVPVLTMIATFIIRRFSIQRNRKKKIDLLASQKQNQNP